MSIQPDCTAANPEHLYHTTQIATQDVAPRARLIIASRSNSATMVQDGNQESADMQMDLAFDQAPDSNAEDPLLPATRNHLNHTEAAIDLFSPVLQWSIEELDLASFCYDLESLACPDPQADADSLGAGHSIEEKNLGIRRKRFTEAQTKTLLAWLSAHITSPYPTDQEKGELAAATGLTQLQIQLWFTRTRQRKVFAREESPTNHRNGTASLTGVVQMSLEVAPASPAAAKSEDGNCTFDKKLLESASDQGSALKFSESAASEDSLLTWWLKGLPEESATMQHGCQQGMSMCRPHFLVQQHLVSLSTVLRSKGYRSFQLSSPRDRAFLRLVAFLDNKLFKRLGFLDRALQKIVQPYHGRLIDCLNEIDCLPAYPPMLGDMVAGVALCLTRCPPKTTPVRALKHVLEYFAIGLADPDMLSRSIFTPRFLKRIYPANHLPDVLKFEDQFHSDMLFSNLEYVPLQSPRPAPELGPWPQPPVWPPSPKMYTISTHDYMDVDGPHETMSVGSAGSAGSVRSACSYSSFGRRGGRRRPTVVPTPVMVSYPDPGPDLGPATFATLTEWASQPPLRDQAERKSSRERDSMIYHCTFCMMSFSRKYTWKRHEESTHVAQKTWVCHYISSGPACQFCSGLCFNDPLGTHHHKKSDCWARPVAERTFLRRDNMLQHLRGFHNASDDSFAVRKVDQFITVCEMSPMLLTCWFCQGKTASWDARASHIALHFEQGVSISSWKPPDEWRALFGGASE